jgi:hypothetical protein
MDIQEQYMVRGYDWKKKKQDMASRARERFQVEIKHLKEESRPIAYLRSWPKAMLKEMCELYGLRTDGSKKELATRLSRYHRNPPKKIARSVEKVQESKKPKSLKEIWELLKHPGSKQARKYVNAVTSQSKPSSPKRSKYVRDMNETAEFMYADERSSPTKKKKAKKAKKTKTFKSFQSPKSYSSFPAPERMRVEKVKRILKVEKYKSPTKKAKKTKKTKKVKTFRPFQSIKTW